MTLLHDVGRPDLPLVVMGGLVPEMLTRGQDPPAPLHLGTMDVDLLIDIQLAPAADLSPVERSLKRLGFRPDPGAGGWRWVGRAEGVSRKIEFLCELPDEPAEAVVHPAGCSDLGAMNLRGAGHVAKDWEAVRIAGAGTDGRPIEITARFAGLSGFLLAKAAALAARGLERDCYDLAYVLIYNRLGGPREAARSLKAGRLSEDAAAMRTVWTEIASRFESSNSFGPTAYATQARLADPQADARRLRQDAVSAVRDFLRELGAPRTKDAL